MDIEVVEKGREIAKVVEIIRRPARHKNGRLADDVTVKA
jgi:hypothetical protein